MMSQIKKSVRGIAILMAGLALLSGFAVFDLQAGPCEDAFLRCLGDVPFTNPWLCTTGWIFCKKYIL